MLVDGHGPEVLAGSSVSDVYPVLVERLRTRGALHRKPEYAIRELHPFLLSITNPRPRILEVIGRLPNPGFMAAEAIWTLSGSDEDWIFAYNRRLEDYTGRPVTGAYGPRLRRWRGCVDQIKEAVDRLHDQPESQRVTLVIFDPEIDQTWHRTVPCTNLLRFMARHGRLDMTTVMRAQDIWLGFPYDFFTFSLLHELMAGFAGVEVGTYFHFMDVLRLYQGDWEASRAVSASAVPEPPVLPAALGWTEFERVITVLAAFARDPLSQDLPLDLTPFWTDMALTLRSYLAFRARDFELAFEACSQVVGGFRRALLRWYERYCPRDPALQQRVGMAWAHDRAPAFG